LSEKFFKERNDGVYIFGNIKLRSYWTKVHQIYPQYSTIITGEYFYNQNVVIATRFGMPGLRITVNCRFRNVDPKIGCHGNVPSATGKENQIVNLWLNIYQTVKICWKSAW